MSRSVGVSVVFALLAGSLVAVVPSSAAGSTGSRERSAATAAPAAAKRSPKGRVIVGMTGNGTYTLRGKKVRKSASTSKMFKVKPGKYSLVAPSGKVKPAKFRVRPGKTVRVKVTFPTTGAPVTDTPVTTPSPDPTNPTAPPSGPVQQWVDAGAAATVTTAGGYGIIIPAGVVQQRSLVSVTPLPAQDGVLPTADFHIDGPWSGAVSVSLPTPADMAGLEPMVLHDTASGLQVVSGSFVTKEGAVGVPTVAVQTTSLSQFTAAGVQCPAADQPLLRALVVGCSDHQGTSVEDVWKATAEQKWQQALALEQADAACGPAAGNLAEVGAVIKTKMSCSFSATGSEGKFRFTNTSDASVLGWGLPVVLGHANAGGQVTWSTDNTNVAWLLSPLSNLGEAQFLYPGAEATVSKPEAPAESDITWKVDRNTTIAAVYLQFAIAQLGARAYDKGALKTALAGKLLGCGRQGTQATAASCAIDGVIDGAKTLLSAVAGAGVHRLLVAMDVNAALGAALEGLADPRTTTTHLINSTPTDPPTNRGGSSWIARNPDNGRAVLIDGATVRPITNGGTFNCLATTRVVWDIPTLRALRAAVPQAAVCDNTGRTAWDIRPAPGGNVGTSIILRDTSTTPHTTYLINSSGELQTIPTASTYECFARTNPVIWNVPTNKINAWKPVATGPAVCGSPPPGGAPGAVQRISTDASGGQSNDGCQYGGTAAYYYPPAWSPDGASIAFSCYASDLVPGDTNGGDDVFVKTLATGAVQRVSTNATGAQAYGSGPEWSPDGASIAFTSGADNLGPDDTNGKEDVFVKTLATGAVQRVASDSSCPKWSPDGARIAFASGADNLVPGDTNGTWDVFVTTLATGAVQRVNTDATGTQANSGSSCGPVWSPDGTRIAFASNASNLVAGDTNDARDVFVKTLATGAIQRINTDNVGTQANKNYSFGPLWSPDGASIAFVSRADNLVPGDTNNDYDVFVKTLSTGAIQRVNTDASGGQANYHMELGIGLSWSPDGTRIAFSSGATNLVPGDTNGVPDVFVKTLATGAIQRVSTDAAGNQADGTDANGVRYSGPSYHPVWSPDGTRIAFASDAPGLVPGDTNGALDVFVKTLP